MGNNDKKPWLEWWQPPHQANRWIALLGDDYVLEVVKVDMTSMFAFRREQASKGEEPSGQTVYLARCGQTVMAKKFDDVNEAKVAVEDFLRNRISVMLKRLTPFEEISGDEAGNGS